MDEATRTAVELARKACDSPRSHMTGIVPINRSVLLLLVLTLERAPEPEPPTA